MKITVMLDGVQVALPTAAKSIDIVVQTDPEGEVLPPVTLTVDGGSLDVYRSEFSWHGPLDVHLFRENERDEFSRESDR